MLTGDDERPLTPSSLLVAFVIVAVLGGLVTAGLTVPALAAANVGTSVARTTFNALDNELDDVVLPQRTELYANDRAYNDDGTVANEGTLLATFYTQNRVVVPLSQISIHLQDAVIATEDKRFADHNGVDPQGMTRALVLGALGATDNQQGASTLTQQYVKNVLILAAMDKAKTDADRQAAYNQATVAHGAEGYARKLREARLAVAFEQQEGMTKDKILEHYLNIAQFGAASIYGAEAAAQFYFGISASELDYLQAATIAGITQNPMKHDPTRDPAAGEARRNTVLKLMREQGKITDDEYTLGVAKPVMDTLSIHDVPVGCTAAENKVRGAGYFCDWVSKIIVKDPAFGETAEDRAKVWAKGGLIITTSLDPRVQAIATEEVQRSVPAGDPSGVVQAMAVVEPGHTTADGTMEGGWVRALAQSTNWTATNRGIASESAINLNIAQPYYNNQGFQPGSTFKAFTLLAWLEAGHSLSDVVNGSSQTFQMGQFTSCSGKVGGPPFTMRNSPPSAGGPMTVRDATRNSVNVAFMNMATRLSLCDIMQRAADLGVVKANPKDPKGNPIRDENGGYIPVPFNDRVPVNVIGTDNTTTLAMASAFAAFASGGIFCTPVAIMRVVDTAGVDRAIPDANCHQEIEPAVANTIALAMSGVWSGTMRSVGAPRFPAAGKTGTSNNNEYTWFVGYTPRLSAAVAVSGSLTGFKSANRKVIAGKRYGVVYGSTIAGPTWKRFADRALAQGPHPGFGQGSAELIHGKQVPVPNVQGMTTEQATEVLAAAGFSVSIGAEVPAWMRAGLVAQQSPAGTATPGSIITLYLSNGLPPDDRDRRRPPGRDDPG